MFQMVIFCGQMVANLFSKRLLNANKLGLVDFLMTKTKSHPHRANNCLGNSHNKHGTTQIMINYNSVECWVGLHREGIIELVICPPKSGLTVVLPSSQNRTPLSVWKPIIQVPSSHLFPPHYQSCTKFPRFCS